MRTIPFVGAVFFVALATGCAGSVQQLDGEAAPIGAASPSVAATSAAPSTGPSAAAPATSAPTPSPPSTTATKTKTPAAPSVLGPNGLGALKLGMTRKQAEATGLLVKWTNPTSTFCSQPTHLRGASGDTPGDDGMVYYSEALGIQVIDGYPGLRTPEGIRIGSSLAAVRKAYPDWRSAAPENENDLYGDGRGLVTVPGNSKAHYRIEILNAKVIQLTLQSRQQNCYE